MRTHLKSSLFILTNFLVGLWAIIELFQTKSETKSVLILGLSARKILLIFFIVLILGTMLYFWIKSLQSQAQNNPFSKLFAFLYNDNNIKVFFSLLLMILSFFAFFFALSSFWDQSSYLAMISSKIQGFLFFIGYLFLSTLIFFHFWFNNHHNENDKHWSNWLKQIPFFVVVQLIWLEFFNFALQPLSQSIKLLDIKNNNHFFIISFWIFLFLLGSWFSINLSSHLVNIKIRVTLKNHSTWYSVFCLTILLLLLFGNMSYGANDDYFMMLTASGQINGIADPHLIYSNVLIGQTLTGMFHLWPGINWYTTYLLLALFLSSLILLGAILNHFNKQGIPWVPLTIFFIFVPRLFFTVNFTSTAMMCAFAGLILLLNSAVEPSAKAHWGQLGGGVLFLTLSGMIRFQALGLSLLLFLPLFITIPLKKKSLPLLLALLCAGGLSLAAVWVNQQAYLSSPEWNTYLQYNQERGAIHGTPKLKDDESHQAFWQELGWGESGYQLFKNWLFVDRDVFTLQNLQAINQEYRYSLNEPDTIFQSYQTLASQNPFEILALLGVYCVIFVSPRSISTRQRKWLIGTSFYAVLLLLGLSIFLRLPYYIFVPALLILCLILLYEGQIKDEFSSTSQFALNQKKELAFFAFLLFCQSLLLVRTDQINLTHQVSRDYILAEVTNALPQDRDSLVVVEAGSFPLEWVSPLRNQTLPFAIVPTGWMINSPEYNHQLEKYGINNLMDSLASNPNLYLLGNNQELVLHYLADVKGVSAHEVDLLSLPLQFERSYSLVKLSQLVEDSPRP